MEWNTDHEPQVGLENNNLSSRAFWSRINKEEEGAGSLGGRQSCALWGGGLAA